MFGGHLDVKMAKAQKDEKRKEEREQDRFASMNAGTHDESGGGKDYLLH